MLKQLFSQKFTRFLFLCLLLITSCQAQKRDDFVVELGDLFTVEMGQTAVLPTENLQLTFVEVLEDSRCPTQATCFWAGQVRPTVQVQLGEAEPETLEFNTNPAPDLNQQQLTVGDYVIELQSLDPAPAEPEEALEPDQYRVTLRVTKP